MISKFKYYRLHWLLLGSVIVTCSIIILNWMFPTHLSQAVAISDPQWSPDGAYLLVSCAFSLDGDGLPHNDICITAPDLTQMRRITQQQIGSGLSKLTWSPTLQLTFGSLDGITLIDPFTMQRQDIGITEGCNTPVWSPERTHIACMSNSDEIIVVEAPTGMIIARTTSGDNFYPQWLGDRVVFNHIASYEPDRSNVYILEPRTGREEQLVADVGTPYHVAVAPNGQELVYPSASDMGLIRINVSTGSREDVLASVGSCFTTIRNPTWSPDGQWVAFTAVHRQSAGDQIYMVHVKEKRVVQLTQFEFPHGILSPPMWSPTQDVIAFIADKNRSLLSSDVHLVSVSSEQSSPVHCE